MTKAAHKGFSREKLEAAFDLMVRPDRTWKSAIIGYYVNKSESEVSIAAIEFFQGCQPKAVPSANGFGFYLTSTGYCG